MLIFGHVMSSLLMPSKKEGNKGRTKDAPRSALPLQGSLFKGLCRYRIEVSIHL